MKKYKVFFEDGSSFLVDANDPEEAKNIAAGNYFDLPAEHRPKGDICSWAEINPYDKWLFLGTSNNITYDVFVENPDNKDKVAKAIEKLPPNAINRLYGYVEFGASVNDMNFIYKISSYISALYDVGIIGSIDRALLSFHFWMKLRREAYYNKD